MSKNKVSFDLKISAFPWQERIVQYPITLGHSEAEQFARFLEYGDHEVDIKGHAGTRLIGWPSIGSYGEDLCTVTLATKGKPIMSIAMDWIDRMSLIEAVRKRSSSVTSNQSSDHVRRNGQSQDSTRKMHCRKA